MAAALPGAPTKSKRAVLTPVATPLARPSRRSMPKTPKMRLGVPKGFGRLPTITRPRRPPTPTLDNLPAPTVPTPQGVF